MINESQYLTTDLRQVVAPLFKWLGGKRTLAVKIIEFFPTSFKTYYEPFFGGGAVFFALRPDRAVLADVNNELINAYIQVRDNAESLIQILRSLTNSKSDYYLIRAQSPQIPVERAARILYLTRFAFNGIHRVNLRGEFNVPYGNKTHLSSVDEVLLRNASKSLRDTELLSCDFEETTQNASKGDVIYFDPPYTVAHANNGFIKYNERIFSWHDQQRLALHARFLAERGCCVVVSNADHSSIHELYHGFDRHIVERPSRVAASSVYRRKVTECLFTLGA